MILDRPLFQRGEEAEPKLLLVVLEWLVEWWWIASLSVSAIIRRWRSAIGAAWRSGSAASSRRASTRAAACSGASDQKLMAILVSEPLNGYADAVYRGTR